MSLQSRNISLDCFRGIFALIVAVGHFYYFASIQDIIPISFARAVDFFFVLSGYVLTLSITRTRENGLTWLYSFTERRFYRIFPVFYFGVLAEFLLKKFFGYTVWPTSFDIFKTLTLTQLFPFQSLSKFDLGSIHIGWSISAEFWVGFIFFPIIYLLRDRYRLLLIPALVIMTIWLVAVISIYSPSYMNVHVQRLGDVPFGFLRVLIGFGLGAVVALAQPAQSLDKVSATAIQAFCLAAIVYMYGTINYNRENDYISPFLFALFIYALSSNQGLICALTRNRIGDFLGKISYPAYLIHPAILLVYFYMHWDRRGIVPFIAYLTSLIILSYLVHRLVEQRFIDYIHQKQKGKVVDAVPTEGRELHRA
jgi:peptidoglycan/LPS O-acetylase OafA/YrhL